MSFNNSIHKSTSRQFEKFFSLLCSALTTRCVANVNIHVPACKHKHGHLNSASQNYHRNPLSLKMHLKTFEF